MCDSHSYSLPPILTTVPTKTLLPFLKKIHIPNLGSYRDTEIIAKHILPSQWGRPQVHWILQNYERTSQSHLNSEPGHVAVLSSQKVE